MELWQEQELFKAAMGLVTVVVGTFIIRVITRKAQELSAQQQRAREQAQAESHLKLELIGEMTLAASTLYMLLQDYWRKKDREQVRPEELASHKASLDAVYQESRVAGEVLELKLEAYFGLGPPASVWHSTMDLLTVRYFTLIGLATDKLLEANAGDGHSGLTCDQLKDQALVLQTYRQRLREATQAVLPGQMTLFRVGAGSSGPGVRLEDWHE